MSSRKARWGLVLIETCAALGIAFFLSLSIWIAGPTVEARFFPVATKLITLTMTSDPAGTRVQAAKFTKLRNCEFRGVSWFYKSPTGELSSVPLIVDRAIRRNVILSKEYLDDNLPALTRPEGVNLIGPWIISLPIHDTLYNSFARIHHRCHNFWMTTTDFYP